MTIHTFGDSHSYAGWYGVHSHHLGPKLCYSFGRDAVNGQVINMKDFGVESGDTVIFCLGEIDCRCHVYKHVNETRTYEDVIRDIVLQYFAAIKKTVEGYALNVCVYNVVPPVEKWNTHESPEYPYLGTDEERKQYVLFFNQMLKDKCTEYGYIFFDIHDHYIDENGFLRKDLSDGNVHIRDGKYINEFIHTCLL